MEKKIVVLIKTTIFDFCLTREKVYEILTKDFLHGFDTFDSARSFFKGGR